MMNKRLKIILFTIPILLLIPLIAMQLSSEVNWSLGDFIILGILLLGLGLFIEFGFRKFQKIDNRIAYTVLVVGAFLLVWAEMAVGIFGTPLAGS